MQDKLEFTRMPNGVVRCKYTDILLYKAVLKFKSIPDNLKNSIREGDGRLPGTIGEMVLFVYLDAIYNNVEHAGHYDYDIIADRNRVEVKTKCIDKDVPPRNDFDCSVSMANAEQDCDLYAFLRLHKESGHCYLKGFLKKSDLQTKARFCEEGTTETNKVNGKPFVYHASCYNIRVEDLEKFKLPYRGEILYDIKPETEVEGL